MIPRLTDRSSTPVVRHLPRGRDPASYEPCACEGSLTCMTRRLVTVARCEAQSNGIVGPIYDMQVGKWVFALRSFLSSCSHNTLQQVPQAFSAT